MASSTHKQQLVYGGATTAPPPTPASTTCPNNLHETVDALSNLLLNRLTPSLSLPTRRHSPPATCPESTPISLSDPNIHNLLLSSASQLGFFQLNNHSVPPQLANSAELESRSLFQLSLDEKESRFPKNFPLGFQIDDEDEKTESFCLDATESPTELLSLSSLTRALEKIGLNITELLAKAVGFENPLGKGEDPTRFKTFMWVHESSHGEKENPVVSGGYYPYIVGLHYQIRSQKYSLLADSGWVSVSPQIDSVLVTVGDIAQVWSNGKLKKVRGRPVASLTDKEKTKNHNNYTMSVLLTLPLDSDLSISPLLPYLNEEENDHVRRSSEEKRRFGSFCFEDYAWRVYHQPRLQFKDPLDRYRI